MFSTKRFTRSGTHNAVHTPEAIAREAVQQMLFWGGRLADIADKEPLVIVRETNDQAIIHIRDCIALVTKVIGLPPAGQLTTPSGIPR